MGNKQDKLARPDAADAGGGGKVVKPVSVEPAEPVGSSSSSNITQQHTMADKTVSGCVLGTLCYVYMNREVIVYLVILTKAWFLVD